jgi:hypothetical protein
LTPLSFKAHRCAAFSVGLLLAGLAACALPQSQPQKSAPRVADAPLDPGVYRVTVPWPAGAAPQDPEILLLVHSAELDRRAGAQYFFVVNATEPILNTRWLAEGSVATPTQISPAPQRDPEAAPAGGSLSAVIRVFRSGQAPQGYPLFDVQRILREWIPGAVPGNSIRKPVSP